MREQDRPNELLWQVVNGNGRDVDKVLQLWRNGASQRLVLGMPGYMIVMTREEEKSLGELLLAGES